MAKKKAQRKAAPRATSRSNSHDPKFARVLGVFAHPDDPEFGAGGSMAKLAKDGANVTYVIVTDGSQGGEDPNQSDSELVSIRQREQRAAAKVLGIKKVEFLGYKDGHLAPDLKLRRDIVRMIRKHKPELVITHIPGRVLDAPMGGSHPDHIAVGEATMAAVYPDSRNPRSEEHTSELQSRENIVCRLLLEKKKKKQHLLARSPEYINHNLIQN